MAKPTVASLYCRKPRAQTTKEAVPLRQSTPGQGKATKAMVTDVDYWWRGGRGESNPNYDKGKK